MTLTLSALLYSIGKLFGITGFVLLTLLIFSGDTARFWNRWIGLDKIIKFQRKFSYFVAFFVIFHPVFFILSSGTISKNTFIPDFTYTPLAMGVISMYIFIGIMIASKLYKMISYKVWQYIHILTYVLFFFALYHGLNGGSTSAYQPIYYVSAWMIIIAAIYRTQYKLRARKTNTFKIKNVSIETHNTFTITVDGHKDFIAGQFCFLRINKNKLYARHPFTISSSPGEDMTFTIKLAGRFTQTAKDLKIGDEILIDGPFGNFIPKPEKDLVFIAGGVGITPFMSILRDNINKNKTQNITLIYGSKTEADIIFKKEIDTISVPWFKKVHLLSLVDESTPLSADCEKGFMCKDVLNRYVKDVKNSLYYICGPEIMKNNAKKLLKEEGVPGDQVFVEDFFW